MMFAVRLNGEVDEYQYQHEFQKYKYEGNVTEMKLEDIQQFVWDYWTRDSHDKLPIYYKSDNLEMIEEANKEEDGLKLVCSKNWNDFVRDYSKDVLVMHYDRNSDDDDFEEILEAIIELA